MIGVFATLLAKLEHASLVNRFLHGAGWSIGGAVVSSGITLVMMILVARLLGKASYGQFVAIQTTLGMFGVFAGVGIGAVAMRYGAELRGRDPTRLGLILTLAERVVLLFGLIATIVMVVGSGWLAERVLNDRSLGMPLSIAAVAVLFTALDGYQKSVLIGLESIRAFATATMAGALVTLPIMLLAVDQYGLVGAASAVTLGGIAQFQISRYRMSQELRRFGIRRNASGCLKEWPILWNLALPALLVGALVSPTHWAVQAMLVNTPNGYSQLAIIGVAMQWLNVIMFIPSNFARVAAPMLTEHVTKKDHANSWTILLLAVRANAVVAIPVSLFAGLLAPYIMELYGESFRGEHFPLVLAAMIAAILAVQAPVGNLIVAKSRMWLGALMNGGWAAAYLSLAYFFISMGAMGVMIALGAAYILHTIWTLSFALNYWKAEVRDGRGK